MTKPRLRDSGAYPHAGQPGRCRPTIVPSGAALIVILLGLVIYSRSQAADFDPELWGTDGNIVATARSGNTLYLAGAFNAVGPSTGSGVPLGHETAEPLAGYPRVAGAVHAVQSDGLGGWYIGGNFTAVGGVPRRNLAHILADGGVADWAPNPDGQVDALVLERRTLYVGGTFRQIGGKNRDYLAVVGAVSGTVGDFDPQPNARVRVLLLDSGRLYVGGDFVTIGGQSRYSLARLELRAGTVMLWDPNVSYYGNPATVTALALQGDTLYVGGSFWNVGPAERRYLAAVDDSSGSPLAWNPSVTGPDDMYYGEPAVRALVPLDGTILVGGKFTGIGGQRRAALAEIDTQSGLATPWNPEAGPWFGDLAGQVNSLLLWGHEVYVGGYFFTMGGQPRRAMGAVDLDTGLATDWDASFIDDAVFALASDSRAVYAGGTFIGLGDQWQRRKHLAAIDLTTGAVKDWNPTPDGLIAYSLAVAHGKVYVGGHFSMIGGQERWGLAAVDTLTGLATEWNPVANQIVGELEIAGDTLYAAGLFTTMGGIPRGRLASFDLTTGLMTDWNPNADDDVYSIAIRGQEVFVGGFFREIGGHSARYLAAVDRVTGDPRDWSPNPDKWVNAICLIGDRLFAAGAFKVFAEQPRSGVAAVDMATGLISEWRADINSYLVYSLATIGDTLFVGGQFSLIGGEPRASLAAVDAATGAVLPWDPDLGSEVYKSDPVVWSLAASDNQLFAGGNFLRQGTRPVNGLSAFDFTPTPSDPEPPPLPGILALSPPWPNPARGSATIRFALPRQGPVSLALFDVHGRRIATLLDRTPRDAGMYEFPISTGNLPTGFYFCRLEAGGASATRKIVVLE